MSYELRYTLSAKQELQAATDWIAKQAPETAQTWFDGFLTTIGLLREQPLAFGLAPENDFVDIEVRQLIYRTASRRGNRALFTVVDREVIILGIRRPGQQLISAESIAGRASE